MEVPILLHEAEGSVLHQIGEDRFDVPYGREAVLDPFEMMLGFLSFMGHNQLERFPRLKIGFLGAGSGWVPFWLDRADGALGRTLRRRVAQHPGPQHSLRAPGLHHSRARGADHRRRGEDGGGPLFRLGAASTPHPELTGLPRRAGPAGERRGTLRRGEAQDPVGQRGGLLRHRIGGVSYLMSFDRAKSESS